jgi:2-(3-amino-3-carboxypropyl)histidine synthase
MKLLLQFPEGLKREAIAYAKRYEEEGHEVYLSASSCYGACDLALDEARAIKADKIIHFGHAPFIKRELPIEVEYVEHHIDVDLEKFKDALDQIKQTELVLATTVQHIHQLDSMKKILEEDGKTVFIGEGTLAHHAGQVLGCDANAVTSVMDKSQAIVFVGDGQFHSLAIETEKPVYVIHPQSGTLEHLNEKMERLKKKRKGAILKSLEAKVFGILVSTKPGQFNPRAAQSIKTDLEKLGFSAQILVSNEISSLALNNFMSFDCYITTACPRISDDTQMFGRPVLNLGMFAEFIKLRNEIKG